MNVRKSLRKSYRYLSRRWHRRNFAPLVGVLVVAFGLVVVYEPSRRLFFGNNNGSQVNQVEQIGQIGTLFEVKNPEAVSQDPEQTTDSDQDNDSEEPTDADTSENTAFNPDGTPVVSESADYEVKLEAPQSCVEGEQTVRANVAFKILNVEDDFTQGSLDYKLELITSDVSLVGYETGKTFSKSLAAPNYSYASTSSNPDDRSHIFTYPVIGSDASLQLKLTILSIHPTTRVIDLHNTCL